MKRILLIILSVLFFVNFSFGADISSCQALGAGYHRLNVSLPNVNGNCFSFSANHVVLDLNGYSIGSNGTGNAINFNYQYDNITVANGTIDNFSNAIYHSHSANSIAYTYSVYNVDFTNNAYDIYVDSWGDSRIFNFEDSSFTGNIYFNNIDVANFNGTTTIEQDASKMFRAEGDNLIFNTTTTRIIGYLNFVNIDDVDVQDGRGLLVRDLCSSSATGGSFELKLNEDNTCSLATGFEFTSNDMIVDLNGHNFSGDGTNNAFVLPYNYNNPTIRNGIIRDFANGIYHSHSANTIANVHNVENVSFINNTNDVYIDSWQNSRVFNFIDCYFENRIYVTETDTLYFEGSTILNHTASDEFYLHSTNLIFNTTNDPVFGYVNFATVNNVNLGESFLGLKSICSSTLTGVGGLLKIRLYEDNTVAGNCFSLDLEGIVLDLNGNTITGDGTGYGVIGNYQRNNTKVQNGRISNFNQGYRMVQNANSIDYDYYIENVTFEGNIYGIYLDSWSNSRNFYVYNSTIDDIVYIRDVNIAEFALNNITSGVLFNSSGIISFSLNTTIGGFYVGNYWGNFVCSNITDFSTVDYNGYRYTVCDSNDYTNTVTDGAPLISVVLVPGGGGSENENWGDRVVLPFGDVWFALAGLFVYFFFL